MRQDRRQTEPVSGLNPVQTTVLGTANAYYRGQGDLVLLCIDVARVTAVIRYEDCYGSGRSFPHIYGPLNLEAVTAVFDFPAKSDGTFSMPPGIVKGEAQ